MTTVQMDEVQRGERFGFGENWSHFLTVLDEKRIAEAERALKEMLEIETLEGQTFLDIGSGSGLSSLAARRLGARVYSFDFDPQSAACTAELKRRYYDGDEGWHVEQGSVLEDSYLANLGRFDIVYSWGVLHHTGAMWKAIENVVPLVKDDGRLFIALYNDQGRYSQFWTKVKRTYCRLPRGLRFMILWPAFARLWGPTMLRDLLRGRPFETWRTYDQNRGMSPWWDVVDWVGGYPFEVAKPEEIFDYFRVRGFRMDRLVTRQGRGCNEFVFTRQG